MLSLCGLWVATALMVAATMYVSLDARYYFFHDGAQRAVWEWAPAGPLTMLAIILLEAAVMAAVIALKRPGALWLRAGFDAGGVGGRGSVAPLEGVKHASRAGLGPPHAVREPRLADQGSP